MRRKPARRDLCAIIGERCARLSGRAAARAWASLGAELEAMQELDVPKFAHVIKAIRRATIAGSQKDLCQK